MKTDSLLRFLDNVEKLGYDAEKAVQRLSRMDDVEKQTKQIQKRLNNTTQLCVREEQRLGQIQTATINASADFERIKQMKSKTEGDWIAIQQKTQETSHQIEFAKAVCWLFGDISQIPLLSLLELGVMLKMIVEAKLNISTGYPIDYSLARDKALFLLELALGKDLVRREVFDDMLRNSTEKYDDLMFDKLGKIERERGQFTKEKTEFAKSKQSFEEAGEDKLLRTAVSLHAEGFVKIFRCNSCKHTMAHTVRRPQDTLTVCPFCRTSNQ